MYEGNSLEDMYEETSCEEEGVHLELSSHRFDLEFHILGHTCRVW